MGEDRSKESDKESYKEIEVKSDKETKEIEERSDKETEELEESNKDWQGDRGEESLTAVITEDSSH